MHGSSTESEVFSEFNEQMTLVVFAIPNTSEGGFEGAFLLTEAAVSSTGRCFSVLRAQS